MKHYQTIVGLPKKKKAQYPDTSVRRIEHSKPTTAFGTKMAKFRAYIFDKTGQSNIHNEGISKVKRIELRKEAKLAAGF